MTEVETVRLIIEVVILAFAAVFGSKYRRYKGAFVEVAEAVKDDRVTWDEAQDIVKQLEE